MLNVSAWSLAVILPLYEGAMAQPKSLTIGFAGAAGHAQQAYQLWVSSIARWPDWNSLSLPRRSLRIWFWVGMKWSFQTPSLTRFSPVRTWSLICAVLPSEERNELAPKSDASASGLLSFHCMSKPHWSMLFASNSELVASLPFLSTVSFIARSRTAFMSHGLPW